MRPHEPSAPPKPPSVTRWILSYTTRLRGPLVAYTAGSLTWHLLSAAIPLLIGAAVDAMLAKPAEVHTFIVIVVVMLALVLVRGLGGIGSTYALESVANGLERDVRADLFRSLLRKSQTFFNRRKVGELTARATGDADKLNLMVSPGVDMAVDLMLGILVPLVVIATISPGLLLSPIVFVVLFIVALREHGRRLEPVSMLTRERNGELAAHVAESLAGIEGVQAAGREAGVSNQFETLARDYRDASVRQARTQATYLPPLILSVALVAAVAHALYFAHLGILSIGGVIAFVGLMGALRGPTVLAAFSMGLIYLGLSAGKRVLEVIDDPSGDDEVDGGHSGTVAGAVVFDRVGFSHGTHAFLDEVSIAVAPGTTVALVGATGSGKSTLVQLLNRTYPADRGTVRVDGVDVNDWNLQSLRSQISVIEQDITLFSRSIADNIAFGVGSDVDRARIEQAARDAQAHDFIVATEHGYDTMLGERGLTLSGGQRQRIAIARALLADPRILILDDSTSALDAETEARLQQAIARVCAGRTTFLITHRLSVIRAADHIVVVDAGRVVDQGDHESLLESCSLYRRMFAPYITTEPEWGAVH